MALLLLSLLMGLLLDSRVSATINDPTKMVQAYCLNDGDTLTSVFRLHEGSDPEGAAELVRPDFTADPASTSSCVIERQAGGYLVFDFKLPLTQSGESFNGDCHRDTQTDLAGEYVEFYFLHQTVRNGFSEFLGDWDQVYNWRCYLNMPVNTKLSTNVTVIHPGLQQPVTPTQLPVRLTLWKLTRILNNGRRFYEEMQEAGTAEVGSRIRFQLQLSLTSNIAPFIRATGVRGYRMMAMEEGFPQRSYQLIDSNGCADLTAPFALPSGFKVDLDQTDDDQYTIVSGESVLYSFGRNRASTVVFMVYFYPCFDNLDDCNDMCFSRTNVVERKRRQVSSNETYVISTSITVVPSSAPDTAHEPEGAKTTLVIGIAAAMGVFALLVLLGAGLLYMRYRRGQQSGVREDQPKRLPDF